MNDKNDNIPIKRYKEDISNIKEVNNKSKILEV